MNCYDELYKRERHVYAVKAKLTEEGLGLSDWEALQCGEALYDAGLIADPDLIEGDTK